MSRVHLKYLVCQILCLCIWPASIILGQSKGRVESLLAVSDFSEAGLLEVLGYLDDVENGSLEKPYSDLIQSYKEDLKKENKNTKKISLLLKKAAAEQAHGFDAWQKKLESYQQKIDSWRGFQSREIPQAPSLYDLINLLKKSERSYQKILQEKSLRGHVNTKWKIGFLKSVYSLKESKKILLKSFEISRGRLKSKIALVLAEIYYKEGNKAKAKQTWRFILSGKSGQASKAVKSYASYRMSWMLALEGKKRSAIRQMTRLLKSLKKKNSSFLRKEIAKDLVKLSADSNSLNLVSRFKKSEGFSKNHYELALERRSWILLNQKKYSSAFKILDDLQKNNPSHIYSLLNQFQILKLSYSTNNYQYIPRFLKIFSQNLDVKNISDLEEKGIKKSFLNKSLKTWVSIVAKNLYKKSSSDKKILPISAYTLQFYILRHPKDRSTSIFKFYAAKNLELLGQTESAIEYYYSTALSGPKEFIRESSDKMMLLQSNLVRKYLVMQPYFSQKKFGIPKELRRYIDLGDSYMKIRSVSPRHTQIRFEIAKIFSRFGHHVKARQRYMTVVNGQPSSKEARASVTVVLDFLSISRQWRGLVRWSEVYLRYAVALGGLLQKFMTDHLTVGMWQIAEEYLKKRQYLDAARAFESFQRRLPRSKQADLALNKASLLYLSLGKASQGMSVAERLFQVYPGSKYRGNLMFHVAEAASGVGLYERAAIYYESFVVTLPKDSRAAVALYRAASLYGGRGNLDRRALLLEKLAQIYPSSPLSLNALLESARLRLNLGQFALAQKLFKLYIQDPQADLDHKIYAHAQVGLIAKKFQRSTKDFQQIESFLRLKPITTGKSGRKVLADYRYNQIVPFTKEFSTLKINYYDFDIYQKSSKSYFDALKRIEASYAAAIQISDPSSAVRGWYLMAKVYEESLKPFQESWDMSGLLPAEVRRIEQAKNNIIKSLKSKILMSYQNSWGISLKYRVFSNERQESFVRLTKLQPGRYRNVHEETLLPVADSFMLSGG